ncbi:hypothetical protein SEA_PUPPER_42 [Gordonia phage Pupper]|uniref:Uncharacterized protein n=1 Tax=Gordonia phage Pupper TaxID=2571249 RepID=A0A4Y6ES05_9CAUD|nr:hypothetical protein KHQ83_gp042 [Gordonia phage Pupper]QDF18529.1 hypothetical protein SEA_PUPPER_42 [Gordonia phage Pupper]QDF18762.1 hypothetical protein SEA_SCENTAE_42 [Gordonia phage SCentae]
MTDTKETAVLNLDRDDELPDWVKPGAELLRITEGGGWSAKREIEIETVVLDRILKRDLVGHRKNGTPGTVGYEIRWRRESFTTDDSIGHFGGWSGALLYPVDSTASNLAEQQLNAELTRLYRRFENAKTRADQARRAIRSGYHPTDDQVDDIVDAISDVAESAANYSAFIREKRRLL